MTNKELKVDLNRLLLTGTSIEEYFILSSIYYSRKSIIEKYVLKCKTFDVSVFDNLVKKGYLEIGKNEYTFDDLSITKKAISDLGLLQNEDHEAFFEEFKSIYPSVIKSGNVVIRRLHQDLGECKKKYKSLIKKKEDHDLIIKCVKLYVEEHRKANKMEFLQMISSFLNQKNYEMYMEEAKSINSDQIIQEDQYDVI